MFQLGRQTDIMRIVRVETRDLPFKVGFSLPDTGQTEPIARVDAVSSIQTTPVHFQDTVAFDVWAYGPNARSEAFRLGSMLYEKVMELPHRVQHVSRAEPIASVQVHVCPIAETPKATFVIALTTESERKDLATTTQE